MFTDFDDEPAINVDTHPKVLRMISRFRQHLVNRTLPAQA